MTEHRPIITDPAHLAELAGTAYLCVRPTGEVADAYERIQRPLRAIVGEDSASWPAVHMSLGGFGSAERPLAEPMERAIASVVEAAVREISPLHLGVDRVDAFSEARIHIVRIRRTAELSTILGRVRRRVTAVGLPAQEHIAVEDWVFHLWLVYYRGERWSEIEVAARRIPADSSTCVVHQVELLGFDGGPERLLGRYALFGRW